MGSNQNYGPFWGLLNTTKEPKRAKIFSTTHVRVPLNSSLGHPGSPRFGGKIHYDLAVESARWKALLQYDMLSAFGIRVCYHNRNYIRAYLSV